MKRFLVIACVTIVVIAGIGCAVYYINPYHLIRPVEPIVAPSYATPSGVVDAVSKAYGLKLVRDDFALGNYYDFYQQDDTLKDGLVAVLADEHEMSNLPNNINIWGHTCYFYLDLTTVVEDGIRIAVDVTDGENLVSECAANYPKSVSGYLVKATSQDPEVGTGYDITVTKAEIPIYLESRY